MVAKGDTKMVNGDPNTFLFSVLLKITYPTGAQLFKRAQMGGSNWKQAYENAVNCYKAWFPDCKVEAC